MTATTSGARRALGVLIDRAAGIEDLTVCVQSGLSVLAAVAGGPGVLDCIDEGRVKALAAGDGELADLLKRALEALEERMTVAARHRAPALAA
jgi:hypothetical protein